MEITLNDFEPNGTCEPSDCCGDIHLTIQNNRDIAAGQFYIKFYASEKNASELTTIFTDRASLQKELLAHVDDASAPVLKINHINRLGSIDTTVAWTRASGHVFRSLIGVVDFDPRLENVTGVLETEEFENNVHILELPFADLHFVVKPVPPLQVDGETMVVTYNAVLENYSAFKAETVRGSIQPPAGFDIVASSKFMDDTGRIQIDAFPPDSTLILSFSIKGPRQEKEIVLTGQVETPMCDLNPADNLATDSLFLYDVELAVGGIPPLRPKILFNAGKDSLNESARMVLDHVVSDLKTVLSPDDKIRISGHTDTTGTVQYNMSISQRRADTVKSYMNDGLDDNINIHALGFGESCPQTFAESEDAVALQKRNRRVEIDILSSAPAAVWQNYIIPDIYRKPAVFEGTPMLDTLYIWNRGVNPAMDLIVDIAFLKSVLPDSSAVKNGVVLSTHKNRPVIAIKSLASGDAIKIPFIWQPENAATGSPSFIVDTVFVDAPWDIQPTNNRNERSFILLSQLPNVPPEALNVKIAGYPTVGESLTSRYVYFDVESDPEDTSDSGTSLSWLVDGVVVSNNKEFIINQSHVGKRVGLQVEPKAQTGDRTGKVVRVEMREPISTNTPPRAENVKIVGADREGDALVDGLLTVQYNYVDDEGDEQDDAATQIVWFIGDKRVSGSSYKVELNDRGNDVKVIVTPAARSGVKNGVPSENENKIRVPLRK